MADKKVIHREFGFSGEWIPDQDPLKIGAENFALLRNFRYINGGIEPIEAYTEINTTALATQLKVRAAHQLRTPYTQKTFVLAEAWNTGLTSAKILSNETTIPNQGNFEDETGLFSPTSGAAIGSFARGPRGLLYSNEKESCIYEGEEMRAAAVLRVEAVSGLTMTDPVDFSEELTNESQDSLQTMAMNGDDDEYIVFSTRPLQGVKVYIKTANDQASTVTVKEWQGSWSAGLSITDGTKPGAISHAQTGTITWTATGSAKPAYIEGYYLYAYHFALSAIGASKPEIYSITCNSPFQEIVDVWDGVYRSCIAFHADITNVDNDYTLEVNEESNIDYPIAAQIGALDTTDTIIVMCEEQAGALRLTMIGQKVNAVASVMTVKYWNGDSYATVGTIYDGTIAQAGITLSGSGVISWVPPSKTLEKAQTLYGVTGYAYEITVSVQLTAGVANVLVDTALFVPAPRTLRGHKYPSRFQGRAMFCGDTEGKEENRVDYSLAHAPDVHNGDESSARGQALFFGGPERLTCSESLYNRFGAQIYETWLAFKESETHLLNGTGPEDFRIYQISTNYGCPAPKTLAVAEIAYEVAPDALRNIAIWMSYRGPVLFDGAVIVPLQGIDLYFDVRKSTYINTSAIANAHGWFDSYWMEYNLCIPTGTSTVCDVWVAYDLRRKRWFRKYPDGGASVPQASTIVRDEQGAAYPYVFTDDGIMHRDGYGTSWNGTAMIHKVKTADILPAESIFFTSRIDTVKVLHQTPDFSASDSDIVIHIQHYRDGESDGESLDNFSIGYDDLSDTYYLTTEAGDYLLTEAGDYILIDAYWYKRFHSYYRNVDLKALSHQFEFWRQSDALSYRENFGKTLIGWGYSGTAERLRDARP